MMTNLLFSQLTAIGKRFAMVLTMLLIVGIGQVWGYTITFSTGNNTGTKATTSTTCASLVSEGSDYLTGNLQTATNVYPTTSNNLRIGNSSAAGTLKMNLSNNGKVNATTIIVKAKQYASDKGKTLEVNGSQAQTPANNWGDLTFTINADITYIELVASGYLYVQSITINTNGGESGDNATCGWIEADISEITSTDNVVITMSKGDNVWALANNKGTGSAPTALPITIANGEITPAEDDFNYNGYSLDHYTWNISTNSDALTFYPKGSTSTWLYCTGTNNGVRVGTNANKTFQIAGNYLKHNGTSRYVGVYIDNPDWRCYTSTTSNISGQTLKFYKYVECTTETTYSVTIDPNIKNGTVTANPKSATAGTEIALTAAPEKGYQFSSWTVTKEGGGTVEVTNNIFTMPASDVTVSATFVAIPQLDTPANLEVTNITCTGATLSWNNVANNNGYTLSITNTSSSQTFNSNIAKDVTSGSPTLNPGTTYTWKVTAKGDGTNYTDSEVADGGSFTTNYKITYNVKGGTWTACADGCVAGGEKFEICSTEPSRDGYNFVGWSTADDTEAEYQAGGTINNVSANTTLYAVWEQPKYTVNWYVNGTSKREQTDVEGAALTDIPEPTTADCDNSKVFVGWTTKADYSHATDAPTGMITNTSGMTMPEGGEEYYAVFATSSGGSGSVDYSSTHTSNVPINAGTAITNTNVIIESKEYAATKAGTGSVSGSVDVTIPAGTTQLSFHMAGWKEEGGKTITLTGATADPSSFKTIADAGVSGNGKYTLSGDVAQYAYSTTLTNITQETKITFANNGADQRFVIWGVNASTGVSYSGYTTTCDNTKATVTYDLNGGTEATCEQTTVTKDEAFNLCSSTPTKEGYTFAGWSDGTKTYAAGAEVTISESTTFYATWTAKTITITWDQNYTDCPEAATSTYIYDGEEIAMPAEPIRTGYKFTGWFDAATDGTQVTEVGETNKPTTDVTYYAHWAQLYTVTFMASGQVYVVQEHKYLSGETLELPADPSAANYACDGYIFDGWSVAEKTIEEATKPELISNPTITNDETYYAVWKKATIAGAGETILFANFDDNNGTGGNDGKWNDNIATASIQLPANWNHAYGYGANQCIKLGTGDKKGSVTTPALSQLSGNATLSFKAAAWNGSSESTTLVLSIGGGGSLSKTSVTLTKGAWQSYEVAITGGTSSTRITFAGKNTSNSRFFLDEVKVTTSGSYNYTTSPSCGPTIVAKDGMWVTSSNGQSVKVNVPIAIKSFTTNATITGTTANTNFAVTTLENTGNGEHNLVVTYTPNASNIKEDATITLTAKVGEETISTTTFTLNGRSLPDEFAIVVDKASEYFALPANMPSAGTYPGYSVTLNAGSVTSAPKTHLYTAQAVHNTRFAENGTALRLVGNNNACLWATNAVSGTDIRNYAQLDNAKTADYEWNLYTEDGDTYRISCSIVTEEGRILRMYGANFGMYKSGAEVFYLLPVECTSTPTNIQVSPARVSATISWENAATCKLQVLKEGTLVQTIPGAVSPVVVTGLEELTAYTFTLTPTDAANCKVDGAFTTTGPDIDIVEWMTDGMIIQVDKDDAVDPSVVINGEVEYNTGSGAVATELFFSKYFEAHGENKLLAIYNGTGAPIDLSGYEIKSENGALDLSQFGQTEGQVAPNEEIILVYYDVNYSAEECAEKQEGYENWNILTKKSVLAFSGRGSIGLYKDDVLIDVIGSTFPSGELTKIGKSTNGSECEDADVQLYVDEGEGAISVNDQSSFFCYDGDNIKTDEDDYAISTNRCLLIRKNTVTSGANAVATNKADAGATCRDLSLSFTTLCSEWSGFRIGSGKSSSDEIEDATCDGLGYVGGFDYGKYYREYQQIGDSKTLDKFVYNEDENLYKIPIDSLSNYSCLNVSVELLDPETNELLTQQVAQVPIIVASKNTTTDELFSNIVEGKLDASKTRCSTCDVVILENATLTKANAETENDVNQVRNIHIYPGGKLVVPAGGDDYSVNSLSLRRVEDEVSMASVQTPLLITSSAANPIYVDVRVNSENWHWFTLPHNCNIADVTWSDGTPAKYGTDWFLMWYDGESRAASTNPRDNHWKKYNGSTIEAGKGYIVGITGHPTKSKVKYELRFPMAQEVLTKEQENKTVAVNAWGVQLDNTPNNLGWNLVGNPYLDYYQKSAVNTFSGLRLGGEYEYNETTGKWHDTGMWNGTEKNLPYIVVPVDGGWISYDQVLASEIDLKPFTSYFVQVGNSGDSNGQQYDVLFTPEKRGRASLIRRAPNEVDEQEEPAIVAVELTNSKGESDKTTLLIADRFTDEYEMNADFFKWFGDYYTYYTKPVLYTIGADNESRAFNALNEQLAAQPVALGMYAAQAGNYTFSLNQRSNLTGVAEVWLHDANSNTHTNLMQDDYSFSTAKTNGAGRFSLSVKMASKVTTSVDNITANGIWATTQDNQIVINGLTKDLQLWIYDATGKLLHADHTTNYQHSYSVPTSGVYFVRVNGQAEAQTIKVVVE